ncbi:MAG: TadE family protein [Pseudomonadota bacterium]
MIKIPLTRLRRNKDGSAAIEFAIVVPVFLMVMFSTFEVGWFYFVNSSVDAATINLAREIRTGQVRGNSSFSIERFFDDKVCPRLEYFGDCDRRLTAEVKTYPDFATLAADQDPMLCRDDDPDDVDDIIVDPGGEQDIVRIRLCLIYDTLNPAIGVNLAGADGRRRIMSTYIIKNEPYERNNRNGSGGSSI